MLLNDYLDRLQNLTKEKITYAKIAETLKLKGKQSVAMRIKRGHELEEWEILALDKRFNVSSKNTQNINDDSDDCITLPVRGEVTASLGTGIEVYNENQTGYYRISAKVMKDLGADAKQSDVIFAEGDSMEPTIQGGSALIVDKSRVDIKDGKIYCIYFNGAVMAKRLQLLPPKKLRVISDNFNKYPAWDVDLTKPADFDFKIIGEVMRWMTNAR